MTDRNPYRAYFRLRGALIPQARKRGMTASEAQEWLERFCEARDVTMPGSFAGKRDLEVALRELESSRPELVSDVQPPARYEGPGTVGWRFWLAETDNGWLSSPFGEISSRILPHTNQMPKGADVLKGRTLRAQCSVHDAPPHPDCLCGVYACATVDNVVKYRGMLSLAEAIAPRVVLTRVAVADAIMDPKGEGAMRGSRLQVIGPAYACDPWLARPIQILIGCEVVYVGRHLPKGDPLRRLVGELP